MNEQLNDYILNHIDAEPEHLYRLERDTHLRLLYSRMCSGHLQGRLLKMLVRMAKPERILELGTFSGYSAQCLAEGLLSGDAQVHTIEIEDELEDFLRQHFADSPVGHRIHLHIGDASQILPQLNLMFDLVFIDANKRHYPQYYELVLPWLTPGGFIIADNTLWDGKVAEPHAKIDPQTEGILSFNQMVAADPRVEKVIIPVRDGLTIIYKKP
ncbi:MAG: O-methyltransferase [bacterium]|nr:O-methyltransferase [bacterium]MDY4185455.1 O-methyltransferase [Sodaliphilus sp.]